MTIAVCHLRLSGPLLSLALIGGLTMPLGVPALAQSSAAFATLPYSQTPAPNRPPETTGLTTLIAAKPPIRLSGPAPIVMFRATPSAVPTAAPINSITEQDVTIPALPQNNNGDEIELALALQDQAIAPSNVSNGNNSPAVSVFQTPQPSFRPYRRPLRRIWEDTRTGLTQDLPEAIADALPWVDRDAKNEPFDRVLDRVSDDLHRAVRADPAWALPAHREIRALSKRLDALSAPPPLQANTNAEVEESVADTLDDRPFRPRPIWPGASGRPEEQIRPATLTTIAQQQDGPRTAGIAGRYLGDSAEDVGNPSELTLSPASKPQRPATSLGNSRRR